MGNYYTSWLHVTVSPDMIGEGIECVSDNGTVMVVGSSTITTTMGINYYAINIVCCVLTIQEETGECRSRQVDLHSDKVDRTSCNKY